MGKQLLYVHILHIYSIINMHVENVSPILTLLSSLAVVVCLPFGPEQKANSE